LSGWMGITGQFAGKEKIRKLKNLREQKVLRIRTVSSTRALRYKMRV